MGTRPQDREPLRVGLWSLLDREPVGSQRDRELRRVEFVWLGSIDPSLWNWLRVTAPEDATAAEIALELCGNPRTAAGLMMAGRYVGVPPAWASRFGGARIYRPEPFMPDASMLGQLATSRIADAIALSQGMERACSIQRGDASHSTRDRAALLDALGIIARELEQLYRELERWELHTVLIPALTFVWDKQLRLRHAPPREAVAWAVVVTQQREIVEAVAAGVRGAVALLARAGVVAGSMTAAQEVPSPHILRLYAGVAGASQLVALARRALRRAVLSHALLEAAHTSGLDTAVVRCRRFPTELSGAAFAGSHPIGRVLAAVEGSDG
jgi:hypothetical protein